MSDSTPQPSPATSAAEPASRPFFRPWTVLAGFGLGLGLMAWAGRTVIQRDLHPNAVRFHPMIAPDSQYEPTMGEMRAFVRARCRPDQILVIVGGNSILLGVGQPADRVWTKRLQEILGDRYAVVNLAFRGSSPTDGGAFVAESLRDEFPRQIYIANAAPTQAPTPGGSSVYRWVYWDAYYKGLLLDAPAREKKVADTIYTRIPYPDGHVVYPFRGNIQELKLAAWLDSWCYFNDFWNDVAYEDFNTVWGNLMPGLADFMQPRKNWRDPDPDGTQIPMTVRFPATTLEGELANIRGNSQYAFNKDAAGKWEIYLPLWDDVFQKGIQDIFPPALKSRTLILLSGTATYYTRWLTEDERYRDKIAYEMAVQRWKAGGFDAMEYGRDFAIEDFYDRTHLTATGALKLSGMVAPKVREMAQQLGYLPK